MPTNKKRHVCKECGIKSVETKMIFDKSWFHISCYDTRPDVGSEHVGCPHQLLDNLEKCPYKQLLSQKYSNPFWLDIRQKCPETFQLLVHARHCLSAPLK